MGVPFRHVFQQGPVIAAIARGAIAAARGPATHSAPTTPGPWIEEKLPPRPDDLIRDYVRHVGGDPSSYRNEVPPHLFPQWVFPLQARALEGIPYPMQKVLNGGCRLKVVAPLPTREALVVRTRLEGIDDDGRRAVIHLVALTGTRSDAELLRADLFAIVPLAKKKGDGTKKKEPARVPKRAQEIQRWKLGADAGLDFAKLTGDFNPVHWVKPYARAFGFRSCILHGFSTFARSWEGLRARMLRPSLLDVRFTKPLVLPARVGLHITPEQQVFVGEAGGPAYLEGTYA